MDNKRRFTLFSGSAALLLTLVQIGMGLLLAPGPLSSSYTRFNNWDSRHYLDIAKEGYHLPSIDLHAISSDDVHQDRANAGFFPAYPILARGLTQVAGLSHEVSLLVVSQLSCALFWVYFLLLLGSFGVTRETAGVTAACALAYPTMFFLVMGYSESLFLASLFGMIFWTEKAVQTKANSRFWVLAAFHGAVLTASRLVGLPLVIYPVLRFLERERRLSFSVVPSALSSLVALGGAGSFFLFCHRQFGIWNLYIVLQQKGWQNFPDYWAIFKPWSYLPYFFFEDTMDSISRASVPISIFLLAACAWKDFKSSAQGVWKRAPLYFIAFVIFYVSLSGKANAKMDSMSRYTLPVYLLVLVAWVWQRAERSQSQKMGSWGWAG